MKKISVLYFMVTTLCFASEGENLYEVASNHTLKIEFRPSTTAYESPHSSVATGFWLGKKDIIVTNAHVANLGQQGSYKATNESGSIICLDLVYSNPLWDLAYLTPQKEQEYKAPTKEFIFNHAPKGHDKVFMVGNNGGSGISICEGRIADTVVISKASYPLKAISVSFNSKGGSSGSFVFNEKGEVVGVNYAGNEVLGFVIPAQFLEYDLKYILNGKIPRVYDIGIVPAHILLGDAKKHFSYNKAVDLEEYNHAFPSAQGRLLRVESVIADSPAYGVFKSCDIITHINGKEVGPDLFTYFHELSKDESSDDVTVKISREGEVKDIKVTRFDLNQSNTMEMIVFGNTVFAPVNLCRSYQTGFPIGSVAVFYNSPNSPFQFCSFWFNNVEHMAFRILTINGQKIESFDDVKKGCKKISDEKKYKFNIENALLMGTLNGGSTLQASRESQIIFGDYETENYPDLRHIKFNQKRHKWESETIHF